MASSVAKKEISMEEWQKRLQAVPVSKSALNKLVMNYLVIEGLKESAEAFQKESGAEPMIALESLDLRMNIRRDIQQGKVSEAISKVNDINPSILESNPTLFFHLQQQKLIELIRSGDVEAALRFAQEDMGALGNSDPSFLEELERTLALLAFEDLSSAACPPSLHELLESSQRQKTASALNAAILASQSQEKDPKLSNLLKLLIFVQNKLDERVRFPKIKDFLTGKLELDSTPAPLSFPSR